MSDAYNSEISGPYPSVTVDPLHRGLCISCFRCTRVTVFSFVLTTICFLLSVSATNFTTSQRVDANRQRCLAVRRHTAFVRAGCASSLPT
jgi:hypothetical protein